MFSSHLLLSSAPVISLVSLYAPHSRALLVALPIAFSVSSPFLSPLYYCHLFPLITVTPPPSWALWTHWLPRLYSLCCCALTLFICMHRTLDYPSLAPPPLGALLRYFATLPLHILPRSFVTSCTTHLAHSARVQHCLFAYSIVPLRTTLSLRRFRSPTHPSSLFITARHLFFSCKRLSL